MMVAFVDSAETQLMNAILCYGSEGEGLGCKFAAGVHRTIGCVTAIKAMEATAATGTSPSPARR
jgi:hypothetical protein